MRGSMLRRKPASRPASNEKSKYPQFLTPAVTSHQQPSSFFGLIGHSKAKSELRTELQQCNDASILSVIKSETNQAQKAFGEKMSDFEMIRELGQGASGKVYLMRITADKSIWVVKHVPLLGAARSAAPSSDRHGALARMERDNVLREVLGIVKNYAPRC